MKICWPCRRKDRKDAEKPSQDEGLMHPTEELNFVLRCSRTPLSGSEEMILSPAFPLPFEIIVVMETLDDNIPIIQHLDFNIPQTFITPVRPETSYGDLVALLVSAFNSSPDRKDVLPKLGGHQVNSIKAWLATTSKPEFKRSTIFNPSRSRDLNSEHGIHVDEANCRCVLDLLQRRNGNDIVVMYINLDAENALFSETLSKSSSDYAFEALSYGHHPFSEISPGPQTLGLGDSDFSGDSGIFVTDKQLFEFGQLERDHLMSYWKKVDKARTYMIEQLFKRAKAESDNKEKAESDKKAETAGSSKGKERATEEESPVRSVSRGRRSSRRD